VLVSCTPVEFFFDLSCLMKMLFLPFLFLSLSAAGQKALDYNSLRENADEIVSYFLGKDIFKSYVKLVDKKGKSTASGSCFFRYDFTHPKFSGETFVIAFTLDSIGQLLPGKETYGLIKNSGSDSAWVSKRQALGMIKDSRSQVKERTIRLAWDSTAVSYAKFKETKDFRDIDPGDIVWKVGGKELFRGTGYSGTYEVNVFTGRLTRRFAIPWD
jgi:hypothetical protein